MDLTLKNLPMLAIIAMGSVITGLAGYSVAKDQQLSAERADRVKSEKEWRDKLEQCEALSHKNEQRLTAYLIKSDSIYRAHELAIKKIAK
jgi:hypothetical protein